MTAEPCPVCERGRLTAFARIDGKDYLRCPRCEATVLAAVHALSPAAEKAEYDRHQNDVDDPGYRAFLVRLVDWLVPALPPGARGLDFGCGPGPALADLLRERGFEMQLYDRYYAADPTVLQGPYDFVTCTEVIEHLEHPAETFRQLRGLLPPGGWLALMTRFQTDDRRFAGWHYRRDPTHRVFYREATLHQLARDWGWSCETRPPDLARLRKPASPA